MKALPTLPAEDPFATAALTASPGRRRLHTRKVAFEGYQRDDGLFDIEGRLQDLTGDPTELAFT